MTIILPNLAIAGYRSFGKQPQYFERFSKVNIFIGQNNAGKSNVLRFLHEIYSQLSERNGFKLDPLAKHLPDQPPILVGIGEEIGRTEHNQPILAHDHRLLAEMQNGASKDNSASILGKFLPKNHVLTKDLFAGPY